jgi:hypothetical protein
LPHIKSNYWSTNTSSSIIAKNISLKSRKELLANIKIPYQLANREEKIKILDGLVAATGYKRKHAISMLNKPTNTQLTSSRLSSKQYNEAVRESLITLWYSE